MKVTPVKKIDTFKDSVEFQFKSTDPTGEKFIKTFIVVTADRTEFDPNTVYDVVLKPMERQTTINEYGEAEEEEEYEED